MSWSLTIPSQTEQPLIVEIRLLIAFSEFTSQQFSSGNNPCPTCYICFPLFPKLPPQLVKLSLLGLGYFKLLVTTYRSERLQRHYQHPDLTSNISELFMSLIHMLFQQRLHHNTKMSVCFPLFFKNKIGSWWGSQSDISTETSKRWWQAEILKYYKPVLLWNT